MSTSKDWILGIDYGTTRTCAAVAADGEVPIVLNVEGRRWFPSLVAVDDGGTLRTGQVAQRLARSRPQCREYTPKRHLASDLPPGRVMPLDAVAAVLRRVVDEARLRRGGADPARVVMTHPARWGDGLRARLRQAAEQAGLTRIELVAEPVAAALHCTSGNVGSDAPVVIYDLGAATFDAAVLRPVGATFELAGIAGGDADLGGESFDDLLCGLVGERLATFDEALWARLQNPHSRDDLHTALNLRAEVRAAKERLSYEKRTEVYVPQLDRSLPVTRDEFERLIGQTVTETIDELERTLASAGLGTQDVSAVYLTGDSTRIPAIARSIQERFAGLRPSCWEDPKGVVALGAVRFAQRRATASAR